MSWVLWKLLPCAVEALECSNLRDTAPDDAYCSAELDDWNAKVLDFFDRPEDIY